MAPKTHEPQILLLLLLFILNLGAVSYATNLNPKNRDFDEWVSWHVKNFKNMTILDSKLNYDESRIDLKLRKAEQNKTWVVVSQDGSGDFQTINDAILSVPVGNKRRIIVSIKPGVYREKIFIDKKRPFVTLKGEDYSNPPKITWNDTANSTGRTSSSATFFVKSDYFVAINVIFENTAKHGHGTIGEQAVAMQITGTKGSFYDCSFYGYQDTLYDHRGLHYFKNCSIYGDVDFIFGYGQSLYEDCWINAVATYNGGSITAQNRNLANMSSGFSFKNCKVTGINGTVYLGRSWGKYSRVVYSYTYMDDIVLPKGWDDWSDPNNDGTVYYGEYKCSGPGANRDGRVMWSRALTDEEAYPFIWGTYFVQGVTWILDPYH